MKRVVIKWTYLFALVAFGAWMVDTFFGGNFYLRGEGLVIGQPAVVAAEFNMTVRDVLVKEGEKVVEGTVVANTTSQQVADTRARLTSDAVIRAGRLADMRIRSEVVNATVDKAEHRESVAIEGQNQLNQIYDKGLLPIITRTAAAEQAYNGLKDAESLRAERRALADQITMLNVATEQANVALSDLLNLFDDGRLRPPITGTVSSMLANRGAVLRAGDPLLELVGEHRFVVAWFPVGPWYRLRVGQKVRIDPGNGALSGTISKIGTVASVLPRVQKAFAPTDRQQLIWIEFDQGVTPPPYFTKVKIS